MGAKRIAFVGELSVENFLCGERAQGGERVGVQMVLGELGAFFGGLVFGAHGERVAGECAAAFADGFVEEALGDGRGHLFADGEGAGAFAEDGDVAGIAAELRDVALDPFERGGLIHQAVVAGGVVAVFLGEFGVREEAEDAEAIVHRNDDDAFFGEVRAVLARFGGCAGGEAAAVDPDHDGELVFGFALSSFAGVQTLR